jgi:hypothetical protein
VQNFGKPGFHALTQSGSQYYSVKFTHENEFPISRMLKKAASLRQGYGWQASSMVIQAT